MNKSYILLSLAVASSASAQIVINEFRPNPDGTDPAVELVELRALGGEASFNGFLISLEGDAGAGGFVNNSVAVSVVFDVDGYATFNSGDLENPTFTLFLSSVDYSSATAIGDINPANVLDAIGITDAASGENLFGAALGGIDFAYTGTEPELMFREAGTLDWYAVNDILNPLATVFDSSGTSVPGTNFNFVGESFGRTNPAAVIPEPSAAGLLAGLSFGLLGLLRRRA